MTNIKGLTDIGGKWERRAVVAGADYTQGVQNPRAPWAESAVKAEDNYKAGVTTAAARGAFGKGVKAAGNTKWQTMSTQKGPGRFAEGVSIARPDWEKGYQPYHSVISSLTLPARGVRGSPANLQRVATVATALRATYEKKA